MSLSGGISQASDDAVKCAAGGSASGVAGCTRSGGIRFTLAAGNDAIHANNRSPARANGDNIYTVASTTSAGAWSSFSNYGSPPVDYAEPGSSVYSTYKGDGYTTLSGTSMAAPHLAGLLLLGALRDGGTVTRTGTSETYTIGKPYAANETGSGLQDRRRPVRRRSSRIVTLPAMATPRGAPAAASPRS
jgi:subtilisin family serine protease